MKKTTAQRLKEIMDKRHLKQVDILKLSEPYCSEYDVRLGKNDMSQYVSGKVVPGQDKIKILSLALNVDEAWLMGYDLTQTRDAVDLPSNIEPMPKMHRVPRLGTIACGAPILAEENIECYDSVPDYVKADYTLVCHGDSMINARIFDGDIVCIKKADSVDDGEIAVCLIGEDATLKRLRRYPDHIALVPENPMYQPLVYWGQEAEDIHIIGKATHFISSVR